VSNRNNLANKVIAARDAAAAALATNVISGFTTDIHSDTRPTGTAYDIGADEFQPDTVAVRPEGTEGATLVI